MTEMMRVIAEAEGARTPTRKRTLAELKKIHEDYVAKKAAKKKAAAAKPKAAARKPAPAPTPKAKQTLAYAKPIEMCHVSETGYVREVGYDEKSKLFYVAFAKSTWAMPSSKREWDGVEKAIADSDNFDAYYRATFRGRTSQMMQVRKSEAAQ